MIITTGCFFETARSLLLNERFNVGVFHIVIMVVASTLLIRLFLLFSFIKRNSDSNQNWA